MSLVCHCGKLFRTGSSTVYRNSSKTGAGSPESDFRALDCKSVARSNWTEPRSRKARLFGSLRGIVAKVERTAYLRLAVTFPDVLAAPRSSAGTLDVSDGQRIFRLLANGILFGKDKIVIRYSGPLPTNPSEEYWPRLCADRGRGASIRPRHIAWPFGMRRIGSQTHSATRSRFIIGLTITVGKRGARRRVLVRSILRGAHAALVPRRRAPRPTAQSRRARSSGFL